MIAAHRKSTRWVEGTRWLRDDRSGHLSETKMMAALYAVVACYCAVRSIHIDISTLTLAVVAASEAFGVKTFNHELDRLELKSTLAATVSESVSKSVSKSETINHVITETRGPTGEPMKSLPPRAGATTPSGDE